MNNAYYNMKRISTLSFILLSIPVFGQNVNLNSGFGNGGIVITPNTTEINSIAVDPDGNIFSAGYSIESGGSGIYRLTVTKHTANGAVAANFGTNGIVTTPIDYSEFPLDIKLQADGKILVSGSVYLGPSQSGPGDYNSFVARFNPNGNLDSSFAINGVFRLAHSDSHIVSMMILDDGSVLLAGNSYGMGTISRIDSNGVLDSSFGNNGSVFLSDTSYTLILWEAILLSDQSVICVGYDGNDFDNSKLTYCKIDLNGDFVPGFGQNGKVIMDLHNTLPSITEFLSGAKETADGKIILSGYSTTSLILKINPDGSLDSLFGTNGILNHSYPFADLELQADGKFLIGGSQEISEYNYGFSITRLNADGSLDNSFNGTGTFTTDISTGNDYLQTMKLAGTGQILVAGSSRLLSPDADFMLANLDISQSLSVQTTDSEEISVYPNPFSSELTIKIENTGITEIRLVDELGRMITSLVPETLNTLNLASLANGIYHLLFVDQSGEITTEKVIKH
jgi:uncharacterized delta-60 repeat protein